MNRVGWAEAYRRVRSRSVALTASLSAEDQQVQSMPAASPTKWHLAHTTWFFETFLLAPHLANYRLFDPNFGYLFNSYYEAVGPRHPRPERGLLTRPSLAEVLGYRAHVDAAMERLIGDWDEELSPTLLVGLNHEQQHQELILMDIKHLLSLNPLSPAYKVLDAPQDAAARALEWVGFEGGLQEIGATGADFAFDNEGPRHKVWLEPYRLADRLVTCAEWLAFMADDGYRRPELWLSDGWDAVRAHQWTAPLYWRDDGDYWRIFTLAGERAIHADEPVCHVSFYEADAYARWRGLRLPTEVEWEVAAASVLIRPESAPPLEAIHPAAADSTPGLRQMAGEVWQWTASPYVAYPRFRPAAGALGEYNGKFMSGQMVLRGGACVTPHGHSRLTYRNFFSPDSRWAFSGVRMADDL